jgi:hypothetical protein
VHFQPDTDFFVGGTVRMLADDERQDLPVKFREARLNAPSRFRSGIGNVL